MIMKRLNVIVRPLVTMVVFIVLMAGCSKTENLEIEPSTHEQTIQEQQQESNSPQKRNLDRNAYFGDLHVHTTYSFDAFAFGTLATPYDAYRYAKGEAIKHPGGFDVQLDRPLDFYAVTDHAIFLGVAKEAADTKTAMSRFKVSEPLHNLNLPGNMGQESIPARRQAFRPFGRKLGAAIQAGQVDQKIVTDITRTAWADEVKAADAHYQPGKFTTFAAYEFTTSRNQGSLHRNVIFRSTDNIPDLPFSRLDSANPEKLWDWMDEKRAEGIEILAIPHNSNGSNGQMFELTDWAGDPIDKDYVEQRARNEPLVEITQVKGTSDTHPALSNRDEWADFEIMAFSGGTLNPSMPAGSYVRDALKRGLSLEAMGAGNPYKYGVIGSSDTHTGAGSYDETNFFSKIGVLDATATLRGSVPMPKTLAELYNSTESAIYEDANGRIYASGKPPTWGASGLAAVWAEENTRESIYNAFRRKETFATTGPRMRVRFFAGFDLTRDMLDRPDGILRAYASGVTMGSDLIAKGEGAPVFLVWAMQDALSAPLQRLQIIKGWLDEGESKEEVFDVACSDGLAPDPKSHRCPDNGAQVDADTCAFSADVGAAELKSLWQDPTFDPMQSAFYYVRVLENPTCRWSTWDAIRAGTEPRDNLKKTIQERAWSSPIWYVPEKDHNTD